MSNCDILLLGVSIMLFKSKEEEMKEIKSILKRLKAEIEELGDSVDNYEERCENWLASNNTDKRYEDFELYSQGIALAKASLAKKEKKYEKLMRKYKVLTGLEFGSDNSVSQ